MTKVKLSRSTWTFDAGSPLGKPGGFGAVFRGMSQSGEVVAIKRLHLQAADAAHRELAMAESLFRRDLDYVLPVLDAGCDQHLNQYFIVMPLAEKSLQDLLDAAGSLDLNEAMNVVLQIARGLNEVPDIVHRDLKPGNVLFHDGRWKLADFGIARFVEQATSKNTLKGCLSPLYAAPEQWALGPVSKATDVYALGCIAVALSRGAPPFIGSIDELSQKHQFETPQVDLGTPRMNSLVGAMLKKDAQSRPSINRIIKNLTSSSPDSPGLRSLADAAASVVEAAAQDESEILAAADAEATRRRLAGAAEQQLCEYRDRLYDRIQNVAPTASTKWIGSIGPTDHGALISWIVLTLGPARLSLHIRGFYKPLDAQYDYVAGDKIDFGEWDVITTGDVQVSITADNESQPPLGYGNNEWGFLWYGRPAETEEYRWWQAFYAPDPDLLIQFEGDTPLPPTGNEFKPISAAQPIDDEDFEAFCDDWCTRLAESARRGDK